MYLVTAAEMQAMDRATIASFGIPGRVLMENAGRGAAEVLLRQFPPAGRKRVGVAAGRGNNGGDGFVIARCLAQRDVPVTVFLLAARDRVGGDAAANLALLGPMGVPVIEAPDAAAFARHQPLLAQQDLWVDAILGTGLAKDVGGYLRQVIEFINASGKPVFAVDIPSGLDADTGQPRGVSIRADATATFGFAKTGQHLYPGAALCGSLDVIDIGIPPHIVREVGPGQALLTAAGVARLLPDRPPDSHKGRTGHLLVVAGSPGKTGAAVMTAMAAMRAGAGLVTLGAAASLRPVLAAQVVEAMTAGLPDRGEGVLCADALEALQALLEGKRCLALGPGIGTRDGTRDLVARLVEESRVPLVIDADGLNCLAGRTDALRKRRAETVLTPHPGEMGRLLGRPPAEVQADRVSCARRFALSHGVTLVLKGAGTVVAQPDGRVHVNPTGNAGMASGGMGDVLTGIIAGLVAQGVAAPAAALLGVYLHGAAADHLSRSVGPWGYLASEVLAAVPGQMARMRAEAQGAGA